MKHIEEKAREAGLTVVKCESGDIFVEGPAEKVKAFRETFKKAEQAAIKDFNQSGIQPVEYKVLVRPEVVEERSSGGIILPETTREQQNLAQVKATLIAVGGNAFEDFLPPKPVIGQIIFVAKYAGVRVQGEDGVQYQIVADKDIAAIII
jgi:chaperonin GroES